MDDPPAQVEVTGALALEAGGQAQGLSVEVTPLEAGPTLVLALGYAPGDLDSDCPKTTQQVVVVAWAGGGDGAEADGQPAAADTLGLDLVWPADGEMILANFVSRATTLPSPRFTMRSTS